ncbi:hypothetical protein N9966_00145 [bacterium]|nr:hypothetical protein [bacterium]
MSYISKNTGAFVNARLTKKGRELLSIGQLNFSTFRLGDSEVDYSSLGTTYDIAKENILKPKDGQTGIKTPIFPLINSTTSDVSIPVLSPVEINNVIQAPEKGFFTYTSGATPIEYTAYTTGDYVIQADTFITITGMNGTNIVNVSKGSDYVTGSTEPSVGDFMFVKMSNPDLTTTQNKGVIELESPVPYLWYKVQSLSGTVLADTLQITVDRNLPDFSTSSSSNEAFTIFYPNGMSGYTFDTGLYSGGSVWNMNNVWTNNISGVDTSVYEGFEQFGSESFVGSKEYYGYTSEQQLTGNTINPFCDDINSISIIHYSNSESCQNQPEQTYGQRFYVDTTINESPVLKVPTLMWHRREFSGSGTGDQIGYEFVATGNTKSVTLNNGLTSIRYFDLVDSDTPTISVGRIFPELQTMTIDNQELVAALSYKSNRNWTLPTLEYGLTTSNTGFLSQTQDVFVSYILSSNSGYTTGLHNQNILCVLYNENPNDPCAPDASRKDINITFPVGQLPYMKFSGGTGWYADTFELLVQRVPTGSIPDPTAWKKIDYTNLINSHTPGTKIDPLNLESTTYSITEDLYTNSGSTFNLNDYIDIPEIGESDILQFGDEYFLHGNLTTKGVNTTYRTLFNFTIPPNQYNTSTNPTYLGSGRNVYISELGVYDSIGNLVALGKFITPIEKTNVTTIILEVALDF